MTNINYVTKKKQTRENKSGENTILKIEYYKTDTRKNL